MATAVTSVTLNKQTVFGDERVSWVTIVMSASYTAGGDSFTAAQCGLDVIDYVSFLGAIVIPGTHTTAYVPHFRSANNGTSGLLQAFGGAGSSAAALAENTTSDIHTYSVDALVYGV